MYYPKFIVSNQKEESVGIQRAQHAKIQDPYHGISPYPAGTKHPLKLELFHMLRVYPLCMLGNFSCFYFFQNDFFYAPAIRRMRKGIKRCPCPSVRLSVRPSVRPCVRASVRPSVRPSFR